MANTAAPSRSSPSRGGNLQVMWPEGNVLLDRKKRSPESGVPDYNAYVTVEKAPATSVAAD